MKFVQVQLPLYEEEDYTYTVSLEGQAYNLRIYYNRRMQVWFLDVTRDDGIDIALGVGLTAYAPILKEYSTPGLTGFMWLQSVGGNDNQTQLHPSLLSKYYELFYIWQEEE